MSRNAGRGRHGVSASFFLLPGLAGFFVFFIAPFFASLGYAFMDRPGGVFAGPRNFALLFASPAYVRGLLNTLRFIAVSVPLNLIIPLLLALMIAAEGQGREGQDREGEGRKGKGRNLFVLVFLIPLVIPSGSVVFFWKSLLDQRGALNGVLAGLGIPAQNWLDSELAFPVMTGVFLWKNTGFNTVLYLAGLSNIPVERYEAAAMDGAGPGWTLRAVTLPGLASVTVTALVMSIVNSFKVFREVYLIAGGYPHRSAYTLQHFMNNMFVSLNYPRLSAAALALTALVALCTQGLLGLERKISP
jgi:multiple sugar transport system permease protein